MDFLSTGFVGVFALVIAAFLAGLGVLFLSSPVRGFEVTKHRAEQLPTIMAGRYFFMAAILSASAVFGGFSALGFVFLALAGVAFFDAAVYTMAKHNPVPHIVAGVGSMFAGFWSIGGASA